MLARALASRRLAEDLTPAGGLGLRVFACCSPDTWFVVGKDFTLLLIVVEWLKSPLNC